jgi:hypothetical protein
MATVMIGVDPHKASHTAVAVSAAEEPLGELIPGGVPKVITVARAARVLRAIRPDGAVRAARCELAAAFLDDLRRVDAGSGRPARSLRSPSPGSRWSARSKARTNDLEARQDDGHTRPRGRPAVKDRR